MTRELSPQQLDPLGGVSARAVVQFGVLVAVLVSLAVSLASFDQVSNWMLELAAFASLGLAGWWFIRTSSPFRAPLQRGSHVIIALLLLAAVLLNALAQVGSNDYLRDDWGPLGMGVVLFAIGAYRPAREVLVVSIVSASLVGALAAVRADDFVSPAPALVFALLAAAPVLGSGVGSAVFSASLVRSLLAWREQAVSPAAVAETPEAPAAHRGLVDREVAPFLQRIAEEGAVSQADSVRARALSNELRAMLVIDAERSWVAGLVPGVDDPGMLADAMTTEQRACLRAVLAHIDHSDVFSPGSARLSFSREGWAALCVLEVRYRTGVNPRLRLAPYVAVARSLFDPVHSSIDGTTLRLTVGFEPASR